MVLTKSEYMMFLKHPAWLWLKKYDKGKLPVTDENTQAMFNAGHDFESYVEKLFPDAKRLGFNTYEEYNSLPAVTEAALTEVNTILQGRFESENLTCIVDIIEKNSNGKYNLIEIKSGTKAKPEYNYDLAFQAVVLEECGITINNFYIIHVNSDYVRSGDIDPVGITLKTEVTEEVKELIEFTKGQITKALTILSSSEMPDLSPRYANPHKIPGSWFKDWLEVYKYLNPDLDPYSIYFLSSPNADQIGDLEEMDISLIGDIPEEMALRPRQLSQIVSTRDNKRTIDKTKIKEFLNTFEFPLYFFDYETLSSLIPTFDGFKPYADYPFQYSLHILESPDTELKHTEYLHTENSNPMPNLLKRLKEDIGNKGTVLTWNMKYEKGCNKTLAEFYPEYKEFLDKLNERIEDLKTPFSEMWFVDKDFYGSASIKSVLPVLVPDLSHKNLDVSEGLKARRLWMETILDGKNKEQRQDVVKNLIDYCTLDTYAMVRILEELKKIIK